VALALSGCGGRADRTDAGTAPAAQDSVAVIAVDASAVHALAARGDAKATIVNVWATWCMPCREEFPALIKVARAHTGDGVRLATVSADFDTQLPAIRKFLMTQGVADTGYLKTGDDMAFIEAMHPRWTGALPATFVYDDQGRLRAYWEGAADEARFEDAVQAVLAQRQPREDSRP
jgi:thiol-disulfide isomerase/thioredoxin